MLKLDFCNWVKLGDILQYFWFLFTFIFSDAEYLDDWARHVPLTSCTLVCYRFHFSDLFSPQLSLICIYWYVGLILNKCQCWLISWFACIHQAELLDDNQPWRAQHGSWRSWSVWFSHSLVKVRSPATLSSIKWTRDKKMCLAFL